MKSVSWPQVTLVLGMFGILVTGAVVMKALGGDPTVILTLAGIVAVPVLGALGVAVYQKLDQVKEVSNGNLSRAHDMLDRHTEQTTQALAANTAVVAQLVNVLTTNQDQRK